MLQMCYKCCHVFDTKSDKTEVIKHGESQQTVYFLKASCYERLVRCSLGQAGHGLFLYLYSPIPRHYGALVNVTFSIVMLVLDNNPAFFTVRMHTEIF